MTTTETPAVRTGSVLRHTIKKERPAPVARTAIRRNAAGHDLGTVDLEPTVFGLVPNQAVLHQVVTAQLAGIRSGTHSTLTRAEARGGGAKPFRQKGTGRARQGSSRSPSMSGGGIALGPKPRSYAQHTPKKMVRLALLSALSDRAEIGRIIVVDDWKITEPNTKDAATILRKLKVGTDSVLVVLAQDEIDLALSFRNIPQARTSTFAELSAHDVVRAEWLLFSDRTVPTTPGDFSGTHEMEPLPPRRATPAGRVRSGGAAVDEADEAGDAGADETDDTVTTPAAGAAKATKATKTTKAAKATKTAKAAKSATTKAAPAAKTAKAAPTKAAGAKATKAAKSAKSTKATEAGAGTGADDDEEAGSDA
jgi:large subunit ribosomal protein L4